MLKSDFYFVTIRSRYEEYGKREPSMVSQYVILTDAGGIGLLLSFIIFQKWSELGPLLVFVKIIMVLSLTSSLMENER